ncbi:MAG: septal ring lytic transglycosylase RlpA family protein [Steroidobacteraceae bacterium]
MATYWNRRPGPTSFISRSAKRRFHTPLRLPASHSGWLWNSHCRPKFSLQRFSPGANVQRLAGAVPLALIAGLAVAFSPLGSAKTAHRDAPQRVTGPAKPDLSARKRRGNASYYARQFFGKTMANGVPMNPRGNNAASRTLPLGTVAKVTNVTTGKSAIIKIEDRGPYIKGRIVDLSPSTAHKIGITKRIGVAKVVVAPIAVPLPDGRVKLGQRPPDHHDPQIASSLHRKSRLASR